jgi:hypothetical protein
MPLHSPRLQFSDASLGRVPERSGVFVLWSGPTPVHVGKTLSNQDSLAKAIRRHLNGAEAPGLPLVTHFSYEIAIDPASRHFNLVLEMNWTWSTPPGKNQPKAEKSG